MPNGILILARISRNGTIQPEAVRANDILSIVPADWGHSLTPRGINANSEIGYAYADGQVSHIRTGILEFHALITPAAARVLMGSMRTEISCGDPEHFVRDRGDCPTCDNPNVVLPSQVEPESHSWVSIWTPSEATCERCGATIGIDAKGRPAEPVPVECRN